MGPDVLRMIIGIVIFAALTLAGLVSPPAPGVSRVRETGPGDAELETLPAMQALPSLARQLMDALPGDSSVWERCLSDRAVFVSARGDVLDKRDLIRRFPPGPISPGDVRNPRVIEFGDVAILVFDAVAQEAGRPGGIHQLSTYTWRREGGRWRVIAAQTSVVS